MSQIKIMELIHRLIGLHSLLLIASFVGNNLNSQNFIELYQRNHCTVKSSEIFHSYNNEYNQNQIDSLYYRNSIVLLGHHPCIQYQHQLAYALHLNKNNYQDSALIVLQELENSPYIVQDLITASSVYTLEGNTYYSLDRTEEARLHYRTALNTYIQIKDSSGIKASYINIGNTYFSDQNYDSALYFFNLADNLESLGIQDFHLNLKNNLATVYRNKGELSMAKNLYQSLLFEYSELPLVYTCNLAGVYNEMNLPDSAISILQNELTTSNFEKSGTQGLEQAYRILSKAYEINGNDKGSLMYYKMADSLKDLKRVIEKNQNIDALILQQAEEIHMQENIIYETALEKKSLLNSLYLIIIISSIITLSILIYSIKLQRNKNIKLLEQNIRLTKENNPVPSKNETQVSIDMTALIPEIEKFFLQEKQFMSPNLTLDKAAKKLKTNRSYLSEAINQHYKLGFRSFINELRIQEARKLLLKKEYEHYSIEGIAQTVGFNNLSTFNAAFKNFTGLTPSYFRKNGQKSLNS